MIFDFQSYAEVHFHAVLLRERVKRVFHSAAHAEEEGKIPVLSEQQGKRVRVAFENGDDFVDGNFLVVGYAELHFFEDGVLYLSQHFGHVGKVFVKRAAVVARGRGYLADGYAFYSFFPVQFPEGVDKGLFRLRPHRGFYCHFSSENPTIAAGLSCQIC